MTVIGKIIGLTGQSIGQGTRWAGLGASAVVTAQLAHSAHQAGHFKSVGRTLFSYLVQPVKEFTQGAWILAKESPMLQSMVAEGSALRGLYNSAAWVTGGLKTFGENAVGSIFGREMISPDTLSALGGRFGLSDTVLTSLSTGIGLTTGHLGALGFALPIALAGGKAVSRFLLKGQVARGLMSSFPELGQEACQSIVKQAMKQGLGVPQRVAEVAGQLAQAQLKSGASGNGLLLGAGAVAASSLGLNVVSSGAQSVAPPTGKFMQGFHV